MAQESRISPNKINLAKSTNYKLNIHLLPDTLFWLTTCNIPTYSVNEVPIPDPVVERERERIVLLGEVPSAMRIPGACRFHTRCPIAIDVCREDDLGLEEKGPDHWVACHRV